MIKAQMKDIEATEKEPQAVKDARHSGRLYPSELDEAIVNENPLTYSREKLKDLLAHRLQEGQSEINAYITREIEPLFNLV